MRLSTRQFAASGLAIGLHRENCARLHSQSEKCREIARSVHHRDYLNWLPLPFVGDDVRVEVPEAIAAVEELFVVVADPRGPAQTRKALVELHTKPLGHIGRVLGDVEQDFAQIGVGFRGENEGLSHCPGAFRLARRRSSINWRSSLKTSSPSSNSPRSAWPAPRSSFA